MAWPKGKPRSEETKRKQSVACRAAWTEEMKIERSKKYKGPGNPFYGRNHSAVSLAQMSSSHSGVTLTEECRAKISLSLLGNQRARGHISTRTPEQRRRLSAAKSGERNPSWKGGITPERQRIRNSARYRDWRSSVFERDNYCCQECGSRNGGGHAIYLEAHHIKPFADFLDLRFDPANGITLCEDCHHAFHSNAVAA